MDPRDTLPQPVARDGPQRNADSAVQLLEHARRRGVPGDLAMKERADVQAYLGDGGLLERTTVSMRYRALQQLFKWFVEEKEIDRSLWSACIARSSPSSRFRWVTSSKPAAW